ncbi:MAG: MFS transporter [bacterium]|nr:MFS transporter [bacterium]
MDKPAPRNLAVVWTVAFTNFATPFMFSGVGITLPSMGRELAMGGATLGLFENLYLGTAAALVLPFGRLGDAGDKNSLFTGALALFAASTLALAFLPSVPAFLFVRTVQGVSIAMVTATNMAILTESVSRERLGQAIGLSIGAVYMGLSAGPFVAGVITTALGWRWVYVLSAAVTTCALILAWRSLPCRWKIPRLEFDWPGALTSVGGVGLLVVGSGLAARSAAGWALAGFGAVLLVVFVAVELRVGSPLVPVPALRSNPELLRAFVVQFLTYAGGMGTSFLFSLHLQEARGWTAGEAGRLLMLSPVLMASLAPLGGRLADRVRPQFVATVGVVLVCSGTVAAFLVAGSGSMVLIVTTLVCHGLGFALFSSPNMAVIMRSAPRERTAIASALAAQMRSMGMVFAMLVITFFLARHVGEAGLGEETREGLRTAMRLSLGTISLLALCALVTSLPDLRAGKSRIAD